MKYKAVFLGSEGMVVPGISQNVDISGIEMMDGVIEGLQRLQSHGYLLVIISDQPGIATGDYTVNEPGKIKKALFAMCAKMGIYLDGFYYCTNGSSGNTTEYNSDYNCRKPMPGLILKAGTEMNIDLKTSWMAGDVLNDIEAGNRAGCKSILINNGSETAWIPGPHRLPEYFAKDLGEASRFIIAADRMKRTEKKPEREVRYPIHQT